MQELVKIPGAWFHFSLNKVHSRNRREIHISINMMTNTDSSTYVKLLIFRRI